jgi:hypothetical protein
MANSSMKITHIFWFTEGELKQESEIIIISVQGQALNTTYYATEMLETTYDYRCKIHKKIC